MKIYKAALIFPFLLTYMSTMLAQYNAMENYNGDFESGTFDYWRFVELADPMAGSYAQIVDDAFTGSYAAQITWKPGAGGIVDLVFDNWGSGLEVVEGNTYILNAAIKAIEGSGMLLHTTVGFFNSGGSVINESTINWVLGDVYEVKEHVSIAPAGATNCWIAFRLFGSNGARWPASTAITLIDDVELWEHPPEVTSVKDELHKNCINIYPNPCLDRLQIVSETKILTVTVYNMQGQVLKEKRENFAEITMNNFPYGMYIVKVNAEKSTIFKTIVKE